MSSRQDDSDHDDVEAALKGIFDPAAIQDGLQLGVRLSEFAKGTAAPSAPVQTSPTTRCFGRSLRAKPSRAGAMKRSAPLSFDWVGASPIAVKT